MDKTVLGSRWVCFECQASFFDLNKEKAICPKCGSDQADNPNRIVLTKSRPKEEKKEKEKVDDEIDFDDDGSESGIESFEQLEEALDDDGEDGYA
jgi:uncharacterized protein (TIGR02300 family)